jgi:type I restriction enzyme S subunit
MKKGWEYKKFESCLAKVPKQVQVKSKDYKKTGRFPIVSQESELISGYWDDETIVYKHNEPVIIFGDHTKNIKYIDFDFVVGADGTHILSTKDDIIAKYFFYALKSVKLRNLGYARHYKLLKEKYIPVPPLSEQQRIVDYLDSAFSKIDAMKANAEKALGEAKALFQASLKEMLEPKEGWEEKTLKEICVFSQGVQVPLSNQSMTKEYGFTRFLRIIDFTQGGELPRYVPIVDKKYWMKKDEVAIVRYGASAGYICTGLEGTLANNLFKVSIKSNENLSSKYLVWWLRSDAFQSIIKKIMNGAAMPAISFGMINDISLIYPPLSEQQSIVATLDSLKSKVDRLQANYEKISQECDALKQAILRQIFE